MKKVNFGIKLKDYKGESVGKMDQLNEIMATVLQMSSEGNPIKMNTWAINLYVKKELELDDADIQTLIDFFTQNNQVPNITKAAVIEILESAKTEV